jgi:caffeoyl-CoA O-methyltransferase
VSKFTPLTDELHAYAVELGAHEDDLLRRLREETDEVAGDLAVMQIAPDQGALMALLVRAIGARRALELGTFTGYSAICIARALPEDGVLVACDVSEEWTEIARRYFEQAGLEDRIDLRIAPAAETLAAMPSDDPFDFAFIDADKEGYPGYWEECVRLVRPGGLILVDNVLAAGRVLADPEDRPPQVEAIMATNEAIAADERVEIAMTTVADGLTIALRR